MPEKPKAPSRPKHDAAYKNFFAKPRTVADTLRARAADLARHLDFDTLERMPASFVGRVLDRRHADMLWRVRAVGDRWLYLLVLLEFQSTVDHRMALRMLEYCVCVWKGLESKDLGPAGEYPAVLPVVVYNGSRPWTAPTDFGKMLAPMPDDSLGFRPRHGYLLVELQAEDPASLSADNVLAMIARFERAPTAGALEELLGALPDWLARVGEPGLAEAFETWVRLVLARRLGVSGEVLDRTIGKEEEPAMTTLLERARIWGEEERRQWLREGIEKGILKGIEKGILKGIEKGVEKGRAEGEREMVRRLAARRFGPGVVQRLAPLLGELSGPESVAAVADAVIECETAEEFIDRVREA